MAVDRRLTVVLAALALLAAGCDTTMTAAVDIGRDVADDRVVYHLEVSGDAADVLAERGIVAGDSDRIAALISRATGREPVRDDATSSLRWRVDGEVGAAGSLSELTGVSTISVADGEVTRVAVTTQRPGALVDAYRQAAGDDPALADAALELTTVAVAVTFPGGVDDVAVTGFDADERVVGRTATVTVTADDIGAGTILVSGQRSASRTGLLVGVGVAFVLFGGIVAMSRRRRR